MNLDFAQPREAPVFDVPATARMPLFTERPMPATRNNVPALKAILASDSASKESPQLRNRELREALSRAIQCLEESGRREKVASWLCGQLLESMREMPNGMWITVHRELQETALRQMREVFGGDK